ncbi:MAG: DUF2442 domain-containing protein [Nevskiales bacterium]
MKSGALGKNTSGVEVTNISAHGFWLLLAGKELYVPFEKFPWFRKVPIGALTKVERPQPHHFYWPELDIDLHVDSVRNPERFPLVDKTSA